jgi:hypothetical protein
MYTEERKNTLNLHKPVFISFYFSMINSQQGQHLLKSFQPKIHFTRKSKIEIMHKYYFQKWSAVRLPFPRHTRLTADAYNTNAASIHNPFFK